MVMRVQFGKKGKLYVLMNSKIYYIGSDQCSVAQAAREWVTSPVTRLFRTTLPASQNCLGI